MDDEGEPLYLERDGRRVRFRLEPSYLTAEKLVVVRLREAIGRGELRSGDKLPSQEEIGRKLGVSRDPVYRGLHVLRDEGVLVGGQGARWFVV